MNNADRQYLQLLEHVLLHGEKRDDRTGVGTYSLFGAQLRFDLQEGFPLLTTKKVHWKSVVGELLWFLRGDTNLRWLHAHRITIWDEWADESGELGPIYGKQWRAWDCGTTHIDQLARVIHDIKENPWSRRHIVTAWNPCDLPRMALPPCHLLFQFYVDSRGGLSCQLYQRSADIFLGVPFNIASYALLTHMVAHLTGKVPRTFVHTFGDVHLYQNHVDQALAQLRREPRSLPTVRFSGSLLRIEDFSFDNIHLEGYHPHPAIKAPVAV